MSECKFTSEAIANGYLRQDGQKGIRNKVLVIYTVNCASQPAKRIAAHFRAAGEDVDALGCESSCANRMLIRKLLCFINHQNVGAVLTVGHGDEETSAEKLADFAKECGKPADCIFVQSLGSEKSYEKGKHIVSGMLAAIKDVPRTPIYLSDLSFGGECGGSDFTSGLAANPLVGSFFDRVVDSGGIAMFEEISEAIGLKDYLVSRCANERAAKEMAYIYDKSFSNSVSGGQFSISPGNMHGGLTSVEEKSMGAVAKSGSRPIQGVVRVTHKPPRPGLWYMDCMGDGGKGCGFGGSGDASSTLMFLTCGAHMTFLTSGRGHITGNPVGPIIKVTGNARTYKNLEEDMDINASSLINGQKTIEEMTQETYELVCRIANGERTKGEKTGHYECIMGNMIQSPWLLPEDAAV